MKTTLDDYADKGRALLTAGVPILSRNGAGDLDDPAYGTELVFAALVALMHYSRAAEVDFDGELRNARDLVAGDLDDDHRLQGDEGGGE